MTYKLVNKAVIKQRLEKCKSDMLADMDSVKEMTSGKLKEIIVKRWNEFCKDDLSFNRVKILDGNIVPEVDFNLVYKEFDGGLEVGNIGELRKQFNAIKDAFTFVNNGCEGFAMEFNKLDQSEKKRLFEEKIFKGMMIATGSIGVLLAIVCATVVALPFAIPGGLLMLGAIGASSAAVAVAPKVFEGHFEKLRKSATDKMSEEFESFKSGVNGGLTQMENSITLAQTVEQVVQRSNAPGPEDRWSFN